MKTLYFEILIMNFIFQNFNHNIIKQLKQIGYNTNTFIVIFKLIVGMHRHKHIKPIAELTVSA